MAHEQGFVVDSDANAYSDVQCRDACIANSGCNFWDFDGDFCRLRSDDGGDAMTLSNYQYGGTKHCYFDFEAEGMKVSRLLLIS